MCISKQTHDIVCTPYTIMPIPLRTYATYSAVPTPIQLKLTLSGYLTPSSTSTYKCSYPLRFYPTWAAYADVNPF